MLLRSFISVLSAWGKYYRWWCVAVRLFPALIRSESLKMATGEAADHYNIKDYCTHQGLSCFVDILDFSNREKVNAD